LYRGNAYLLFGAANILLHPVSYDNKQVHTLKLCLNYGSSAALMTDDRELKQSSNSLLLDVLIYHWTVFTNSKQKGISVHHVKPKKW